VNAELIIRTLAAGITILADSIRRHGNAETKAALAGLEALVLAVRESRLSEGADVDKTIEELERLRDRIDRERGEADDALAKKFDDGAATGKGEKIR
jgi:hypothetical protein